MDGATVSQAAYARHRGVSRQAVSIAVREGRVPSVGPHKRIDPAIADAAWDANTSPASPKSTAPGNPHRNGHAESSTSKLSDHRARHEDVRAQLAEIDLLERRGKLGDLDEMDRAGAKAARAVQAAFLRIPDLLSVALAPAMTPLEVKRLTTIAVRRVLSELYGEIVAMLPTGEP